MSRGNQRDKAREAQQKKARGMKEANKDSGTEQQRKKEDAAAKMRAKQAAHDAKVAADGGDKGRKK